MSTDPLQQAEVRVGDVLAGRYRVVDLLGRGGAGAVYVAVQEPLGRKVALKVVRSDIDARSRAEFEKRFLREAALAGQLSHPNVVTVHDFGTTESGVPFVVMELLEGRTLKEAMREGPMDPEEAARLAEGIASGLRHAHAQGMVHRDVKPSNVFLVADEDGRERPMLLDFGLVKRMEDSELTRTGTYLGTPLYMAPEQAKGRSDVDGRADLYALGCVLYQMLTGKTPFHSDNPLGLALQHLKEPVPPMQERAPSVAVPPELERIVRRCMAKAPADRYADGGELARALEGWRMSRAAPPAVEAASTPSRLGWVAVGLLGAGVLAVGVLGVGLVLVGGTGAAMLLGGEEERPAEQAPVAAVAPEVLASEVAEPEVPALEAPEPEVPALEAPAPEEPAEAPTPEEPAEVPAPEEPVVASAPEEPVVASAPEEPVAAPASPPPAESPAAPAPPATPENPWATNTAANADGIHFPKGHADRALYFVNTASREELKAAGIHWSPADTIIDNRPFPSLEKLGITPGIGEKTVQAIFDYTAE